MRPLKPPFTEPFPIKKNFMGPLKLLNKILFYRLVRTLCFQLVIEPGQRLNEDINALVAELIPSGGEDVQSFILQRFN
jgi:hypothetical protein